MIEMAADTEEFAIALGKDVSLAHSRLPLVGRLQCFVRAGSQYAMWRQFPQAIRYEVQDPAGNVHRTPDMSLSISDSQETYAAYAEEPADRIVGKDFDLDAFPLIGDYIWNADTQSPQSGPGSYRIRALYEGMTSNWVELQP